MPHTAPYAAPLDSHFFKMLSSIIIPHCNTLSIIQVIRISLRLSMSTNSLILVQAGSTPAQAIKIYKQSLDSSQCNFEGSSL